MHIIINLYNTRILRRRFLFDALDLEDEFEEGESAFATQERIPLDFQRHGSDVIAPQQRQTGDICFFRETNSELKCEREKGFFHASI